MFVRENNLAWALGDLPRHVERAFHIRQFTRRQLSQRPNRQVVAFWIRGNLFPPLEARYTASPLKNSLIHHLLLHPTRLSLDLPPLYHPTNCWAERSRHSQCSVDLRDHSQLSEHPWTSLRHSTLLTVEPRSRPVVLRSGVLPARLPSLPSDASNSIGARCCSTLVLSMDISRISQ